MLTQAVAKAAAPQARAYKLHDSGGLALHVSPTGTKAWRCKFRLKGREQLVTLGRFPEMPLALARARRDAVKELLATGRDPRRVIVLQANTFAAVARAWHGHMCPRWSPVHASDVLASLERDVLPVIGAREIDSIASSELLALLRQVEARGAGESARRLRQRLSMIFGFAMSQDLCASDPAAMLGRALQGAGVPRPMAALTSIEDCRALLAACDHFAGAGNVIVLASRFLALTAVRLEAVRGMRWEEVTGLDTDAPVWTIPAARMKLVRAKKGLARFDHVVPLSAAAVAVLRDLRSGADSQVSPSVLVFGPIAEGAIRALYGRTTFAGRHVPHGWRASFSTLLNLDMGREWRSDIDEALAHGTKGAVEGAYNRAQLLERRRAVFERWGELLCPTSHSTEVETNLT